MTELKKILIALDGAEIEIVVRKTNDGVALASISHPHSAPAIAAEKPTADDDFDWDDEPQIIAPPTPKPAPTPTARKPGRPRKTPVAAVLPKPNIPIWALEPGARAMFPDENGVMFKGKVIRLEGASVFVNVQGEEWEVPADEVQEWPVTG